MYGTSEENNQNIAPLKKLWYAFRDNKTPLFKAIKTLLILAAILVFVLVVPVILQRVVVPVSVIKTSLFSKTDTTNVTVIELEKSIEKLDKTLDSFIPKTHYLIINSTDNEFMLFKGREMIRKGICSTGSYMLLERNEKQSWLFKTPKGQFKILSKRTDPVWKRPDWAFVEEGLPVPSPNHPSRFEYGVLGDYALNLGQGYMIHGTLWQRYLGLPVTHGCVRLNDADLEAVYKALQVGSKVFIY